MTSDEVTFLEFSILSRFVLLHRRAARAAASLEASATAIHALRTLLLKRPPLPLAMPLPVVITTAVATSNNFHINAGTVLRPYHIQSASDGATVDAHCRARCQVALGSPCSSMPGVSATVSATVTYILF